MKLKHISILLLTLSFTLEAVKSSSTRFLMTGLHWKKHSVTVQLPRNTLQTFTLLFQENGPSDGLEIQIQVRGQVLLMKLNICGDLLNQTR
jgi:hypothetical protein